jgi:nitroreductase/NAD-dependent dihydropyrimidine dehydrogenase PreA subunit
MGVISSLGEVSGVPVIDRDSCIRCGACAAVCATGVLNLDSATNEVRIDPTASFGCIACAHCMMACPADAIRVEGRGLSPADLATLPPHEARATPEQLEALMLARRSVRKFLDKPVSAELLNRIVAAAATAPMGIPPSEVGIVILPDRERVAALAHATAKGYAGMLRFMDRPWLLALLRPFVRRKFILQVRSFILPLGRGIVEADKRGEDLALYHAPAALIFHTSPWTEASDAMIVGTYAMLAAESLGLGTCMIGCVPPILAMNRKLAAAYGIPAGHKPTLILILGYSATEYAHAIRRPLYSVKQL